MVSLNDSQLRPSMAESAVIFRLQEEINSVRNDTLDYADLMNPMAGEPLIVKTKRATCPDW